MNLAKWFWGGWFFNISELFTFFQHHYLPLKKTWVLHLKLNPHNIFCAEFGWNWPIGSGEEDFLNFVNVFSLFRYHLPLENDVVLRLKKSPSNKNALCQVWLKLDQWLWRRNKTEKYRKTRTTTTNDGQISIRKTHLRV